jgi:hypothetical protein
VRQFTPIGSRFPESALNWPIPLPLENTEVLAPDRITVKQPAREVACGHCGETVSAGSGCQEWVPLSTGHKILTVVHGSCRDELNWAGAL